MSEILIQLDDKYCEVNIRYLTKWYELLKIKYKDEFNIEYDDKYSYIFKVHNEISCAISNSKYAITTKKTQYLALCKFFTFNNKYNIAFYYYQKIRQYDEQNNNKNIEKQESKTPSKTEILQSFIDNLPEKLSFEEKCINSIQNNYNANTNCCEYKTNVKYIYDTTKFESDEGYIYIITTERCRKYDKNNENNTMFKVGRSSSLLTRLNSYGESVNLVYCNKVNRNLKYIEAKIVELFHKHFTEDSSFGNEYFYGNIQIAINNINAIINIYTLSNNTEECMELYLEQNKLKEITFDKIVNKYMENNLVIEEYLSKNKIIIGSYMENKENLKQLELTKMNEMKIEKEKEKKEKIRERQRKYREKLKNEI